MIEPDHPMLSIRRQCKLVSLNRSSYYWQPVGESPLNLQLMRLIDQEYTRAPFYGYRKITARLNNVHGFQVNHKRIARLMTKMGLQAVYPRRRTTVSTKAHKKYPYLLRGLEINRPNQVWCADITYVPMPRGFMYLVAVMDWFSRFVLSWQLSNTLDSSFCLVACNRLCFMLNRKSSTPTRVFNLHPATLPVSWKWLVSRSVWTAVAESLIISLLNGYGGRSNMKIFTSKITSQSRNWLPVWMTTSIFTISNGRTKILATWCLLIFILLLMYRFCDLLIHLNFADLWS